MTKQDRKIFNFIMSLTEDQYDVWLETISDEYTEYVNGLFEQAHDQVDAELVKDLDEAQMVLAKFSLKV
jgi:methionine synthase I (cobalamin-dependent)